MSKRISIDIYNFSASFQTIKVNESFNQNILLSVVAKTRSGDS